MPTPSGLRQWIAEHKRVLHLQRRSGGVQASLIVKLGLTYEALDDEGRYEDALKVVNLAIEWVGYVSDPAARVDLSYEMWKSKAVTSNWLGLWQDSIVAYKKAITLGEKGYYRRRKRQSDPGDRRELGSMYFRVGDYEESLALTTEAEDRLRKAQSSLSLHVYKDELARLRAAFALVYMDLGEYTRAEASSYEAATIHEEISQQDVERLLQAAISYTHLGNARREGARQRWDDYGPAFRAYEDALRVLSDDLLQGVVETSEDQELEEEARDRESDVYLERGRTMLLDGRPVPALEELEKALSMTSERNLLQHAAAHHLYVGEAYAGIAGRSADAEKALRDAARFAESYATPETEWRALHELARVQKNSGRATEAIDTLKRCVATIERLRSQYLPESLKISMLSLKEGAYEDLIVGLCEQVSSVPVGMRTPTINEAFGYVERAKSRVFAEQLATTELAGVAGVPDKLVRQDRDLIRALREAQAVHREAVSRNRYGWGDEIEKIEDSLDKLQDRIRAIGPRGEEYVSLRQGTPLDYAEVRGILASAREADDTGSTGARSAPKRVVLVEYLVTDKKVLVFVGRPDLETPRLYQVDVPRERLQDWAFDIENADPNDLGRWDLDQWQRQLGPLVEPLEDWSEENDMVWIVPHAELHLLPLHALKVDGLYLTERNAVCYSPSATVMRYCKAKSGVHRNRALVLGDSLPYPRNLVYGREEAKMVAELFNAEPHLDGRANKRVLREGLRDELGVLHLACHGAFDFGEPLASRILLAPRDDGDGSGEEKSDLTAEEVLGLEIRAGVVTLSACASGVSDRLPGDELIGLTRSFIYAGAPSLLVGLWYVQDRSTSLLMEHFYRALKDEHLGRGGEAVATKARTLQRAQQRVMSVEGYAHPYFWAPFVLVGDWE